MSGAGNHADDRRAPVFVFDLARALSALCVLAAHARGFVLADLPQQPALPFVGRVFFGLTALGHQAVIVFLVLSGTLVTGSMLAAFDAGRWSTADFVIARLNRLWVVLLPCLLLGGLEDAIGLVLTDPHGLGSYGAGASARTVLDRLGLTTLAGNAFFLQGFRVPVFGSNIPLWSLSVEAWCYAAALQNWRPAAGRIKRAVRAVADVSFTLYLAHFPLLALLDAVVLQHRRLPWGTLAVIVWLTAVMVALAQALVLWWLFERHTAALRAFWVARWAAARRPLGAPGRAVLP